MANQNLNSWLSANSNFIKLRVGQKYECIFRGMVFDATGGFQGKPTVKYSLEDISDNKVRIMSSSSKSLARELMKYKDGDQITITCDLDQNDRKSFAVIRSQSRNQSTVDPLSLEEDGLLSDETPF